MQASGTREEIVARDERTAARRFWDRMADRYAKQPVADEAAYQEKLKVTRRYLDPEAEVWEFGCGTGSTALAHAPYVRHLLATDISAKMIEIAERKAHAQDARNVSFRQASIEAAAPAPGAVDVVMAHSILHLLDDWEGAIALAYGALRPGGVLVSSTFCGQDEMPLFKHVVPLGRLLGLMPHVAFFTAQQLEDGMRTAGFEIEYRWRPPGKRKALFLVARKPRRHDSGESNSRD